jgi:hypothetical protein
LVWSDRRYSVKDGETLELGPILYLSAVRLEEITKEQCLIIELENDKILAIRPAEKFRSGVYQIGLVEGKLTLSELR